MDPKKPTYQGVIDLVGIVGLGGLSVILAWVTKSGTVSAGITWGAIVAGLLIVINAGAVIHRNRKKQNGGRWALANTTVSVLLFDGAVLIGLGTKWLVLAVSALVVCLAIWALVDPDKSIF